MGAIQSMLSADSDSGRVTIGENSLRGIRVLSDDRRLRCPACGEAVVLKAGSIVAAHFAHLAGSHCSHPDSEPETEAHIAGKRMIAAWAGALLPQAEVTVEAAIAESGQRADVWIEVDGARVALEYQCAEITAREWLRRHRLYRAVGVRDLWILGAARLSPVKGGISAGELASALLRFGAPLLFLDSAGDVFPAGTVARFRPAKQARGLTMGRFSLRPLFELAFPWRLLDWPLKSVRTAERAGAGSRSTISRAPLPINTSGDPSLSRWLESRYRIRAAELPELFGLSVAGQEVFACSPALWQAAVYYRFVQGRIGSSWWIGEVETWACRYLPLAFSNAGLLRRALYSYQGILSAAGFLSLSVGKGTARIEADLSTIEQPPDPAAVQRLAAYRRSLLWDRR